MLLEHSEHLFHNVSAAVGDKKGTLPFLVPGVVLAILGSLLSCVNLGFIFQFLWQTTQEVSHPKHLKRAVR